MADNKISVAFICTGNICRSPMAEAIFKYKVKERGLEDKFNIIDSFGVSAWHQGESPDSRSIRTCNKHGVPIHHAAQEITRQDYTKFDYLLAMDLSHKEELLFGRPKDSKAKIDLFGAWKTDDSIDKIVVDPYYGNIKNFEYNFKQLSHFTDVFLDKEL